MKPTIETKEVALVKQQASKAIIAAENLKISKIEDLKEATDILSKIKTIAKMIREKKETITKPLNEALKNARELFRPIENDCEKAEQIIKERMIDYQTKEELKIKAKEEKIVEKVDSGEISFEQGSKKLEKIGEIPTEMKGNIGSIATRIIKEIVIIDENKIPREYLIPDMAKIRKDALAGKEIPGIKVEDKKIIVSK